MKLRPGQCFRRSVSTPTFFDTGPANQDIGTDNLNAPSNTQADDICVICVHTDSAATLTGNTGYAHVTGSPLTFSSSRLHVMWRRAVDGNNNIAALDANNGWQGVMAIIRGCPGAGTPFSATATTTQGSTTALSHVSVVAPSTGNLVVLFSGSEEAASSTNYTAIANGTLSGVTEQDDHQSTVGADGGIAIFSGTLAGTGATGTWTATRAVASAMGHISVAFGH